MNIKENIQEIHIGSEIKKVFDKKSVKLECFAEKIDHDRTTVYNIFKRKSIDIDLLLKISKVLDYDFIHEVYFYNTNEIEMEKINIEIEIDNKFKHHKVTTYVVNI